MSANILLVDDDKHILGVFTKALTMEGHNVVSVPNGYEAIEQIESHDFDLAVSDITLPGPDGIEILKYIKNAGKDTEVIMMSGYASLETAIEAMRQGAYDYIVKPVDLPTMLSTVNRGLEKQRQVIETKQLLAQLEQKTFELTALYEIRDIIGYTLDYRELVEPTMHSLCRIISHDASAFLFMNDESHGELTVWTSHSTPGNVIEQLKFNVIDAFNSVSVDGISMDDISILKREIDDFAPIEEELSSELRSFLNVALIIGDAGEVRLAGMINISSFRKNAFDLNTSRLFYNIANNMSNALEKLMSVLAGEKNKLELMVGSMTDGVVMFDQRGHVNVLNNAAKKMLSLESITNASHLANYIGDTRLSRVLERINERKETDSLVVGRDGFEEEIFLERIGKFLNANVSPIYGNDDKTYGTVVILRDITRKKEIDEAKSAFVSSVSHELRTPLTAIRNAMSIMEMAGELNEQQKKFLGISERNIERLGRLINDILDFSKLDDGKLEMNFDSVDLGILVEESVSAIQNLATRKSIDIILDIQNDLPQIYGDSNRLDQVFTNILDNAIKYTPEDGRITISARLISPPFGNGKPIPMPKMLKSSSMVEIKISDTGIGISEEDQKKIFARFVQAGNAYGMGVGLGLSIVKKIIENHYGEIWVESTLGEGSNFVFLLPVNEDSQKIVGLVRTVDSEIDMARIDHSPFALTLIQTDDLAHAIAEDQNGKVNHFLVNIINYIQNNTHIKNTITCNYSNRKMIFCLYPGDKDAAIEAEHLIATFIEENPPSDTGFDTNVSIISHIASYPDAAENAVEIIDALIQNSAPVTS